MRDFSGIRNPEGDLLKMPNNEVFLSHHDLSVTFRSNGRGGPNRPTAHLEWIWTARHGRPRPFSAAFLDVIRISGTMGPAH